MPKSRKQSRSKKRMTRRMRGGDEQRLNPAEEELQRITAQIKELQAAHNLAEERGENLKTIEKRIDELIKRGNEIMKPTTPSSFNSKGKMAFAPTQTRTSCPPGKVPMPKPNGKIICATASPAPPPVIAKPSMPKPSMPKPVTEAPLLTIPQSNILPAKPLKPGPNNSVKPYIPMWNRMNRTQSRLNQNVNEYGILGRLGKFSSPTVQKGKKSYFSRNQVKQELARAKEEKIRTALEEVEEAKKEAEKELQAVEQAPNTSKNMTMKNKLKEKLRIYTRKASNYGKQLVKNANTYFTKLATGQADKSFLKQKFPAKYADDFYEDDLLSDLRTYRDLAGRFGYTETDSLPKIYENLKSKGVEDPFEHMKAARRENVAQVVGIPYTMLEEIRKETGVTDWDLFKLETDSLKTGQKGRRFVKNSLEAVAKARAERKERQRLAAERASSSGMSSGNKYQAASMVTSLFV